LYAKASDTMKQTPTNFITIIPPTQNIIIRINHSLSEYFFLNMPFPMLHIKPCNAFMKSPPHHGSLTLGKCEIFCTMNELSLRLSSLWVWYQLLEKSITHNINIFASQVYSKEISKNIKQNNRITLNKIGINVVKP